VGARRSGHLAGRTPVGGFTGGVKPSLVSSHVRPTQAPKPVRSEDCR
jgi:hypothetical protein